MGTRRAPILGVIVTSGKRETPSRFVRHKERINSMKAIVFLALLVAACFPSAQAQTPPGLFTTTEIVIYDQIYQQTVTHTGCLVEAVDEHYQALAGNVNQVVAECDTSTTVPGYNPPPQAGAFLVYRNVTVNGSVIGSPLYVCNVVIDDTVYRTSFVPNGARFPHNARKMAFRCRDGSTASE